MATTDFCLRFTLQHYEYKTLLMQVNLFNFMREVKSATRSRLVDNSRVLPYYACLCVNMCMFTKFIGV